MLKVSNDVTKIYDALRDLVLFVEFKIREKHPWRSVYFSKVSDVSLQLVRFLHWYFLRFLDCTSCTKLRKTSHLVDLVFTFLGVRF